MDLGMQEILLIAVVALLVYGGELPTVMRSLGRTVGGIKRSFQDGTKDMADTLAVKVDLNADDETPRVVQRLPVFPADQPAPSDVATEDISEPPPPAASADMAPPATTPATTSSTTSRAVAPDAPRV